MQQIASNPQNLVWTFASAGSGKTKVLTDRVIRLLLEDVSAHKILCLTFTKATAAEMQDRINQRLTEFVLLDDQNLAKNLHNLTGKIASQNIITKARNLFAMMLDRDSQIKIQTIHSFCQNLAKIFPFEIGINPNFEVIDDILARIFLQKCRRNVLLTSLENQALQADITTINSKLSEESFLELVEKILDKKEQIIFLKNKFGSIEEIIVIICKILDVNWHKNPQDLFLKFSQKISAQKLCDIAFDLKNSKSKTDQKTAFALKYFAQNLNLENFYNYQEIFFTKENKPRKIASIFSKEFLQYSDFALEQQGLIMDYVEQINSYKIAKETASLLRFADLILEKYQELKKENSLLDYNDLIIQIDKMLQTSESAQWIKFRVDGFFDHILIDESQDTNHRQWNIIKSLTEDFFTGNSAQNANRTIFIIGDDKQSIYSFQGSQPNISHDIFSYFQQKLEGNVSQLQKINLNNSFRSLKNILQFVDDIFLSKNYLGIGDYQPHQAVRQGNGVVEIWPKIIRKKNDIKNEDFLQNTLLQKNNEACEKEFLANLIALKIRDWIDSKRMLEGSSQPINYSDIMILLRNRTNDFDAALQKKFKEYNIPFSSSKKDNFSDELIIQDTLAAAKFALLQEDDLNLAALLKSPFFVFDEKKLLEICILKNQNQISLFEALKLDKSCVEVALKLEEIIVKSKQLSCLEFFSFLLQDNIFGHEALPVLDQFMLQIFDFCENNTPNLQKFLDFIEKNDPQIINSFGEQNKVKITTIHSAKGLQAPVVFVPDCCFNFNQMPNSRENIIFLEQKIDDEKYQIPIWCSQKSHENNFIKKCKEQKNILEKQEYFRLFYVAMTRAENELYLAGFGADANDSWYQIAKNIIANKAQELDFYEYFSLEKEKIEEKFEIDGRILCL